MTREEARTFLNGTKVYVEDKSKEIQEKLFSLGYAWNDKIKIVQYEKKPFLFITEDGITYSDDVVFFKKESLEREISADEILSIEVTVSYRPFKDKKECWNEMLKHQPFGWVMGKIDDHFYHIDFVYSCNPDNGYGVRLRQNPVNYNFEHLFRDFKFADGKPFGIKED